MKVGIIARASANRVENGVDESDCGLAVCHRLLIDEGQIAGPHRRGKTSPAVFVCSAGSLVGADIKSEICVGGNVRPVAIGLRTARASVGCGRLPGRNGVMVGRDAASAIDPGRFRTPWTSGAAGVQVCSADRSQIHVIRRKDG